MSRDDGFVDKWRARWPEWQVAEVFLPVSIRERSLAWFALRQELLDAAWAGADARPGEAKLGWWIEELQGWSQGARRHPLGAVLQSQPVPWARLAATLPALAATRERVTDLEEACAGLLPFASVVAEVDGLLANEAPAPADDAALHLLAQRAVFADDNAVPLAVRARLGADADAGQATRA
ncbi:MAG: phytoene/squalene synthase family protein, partial [Pseudomonadota bacterium]|nr:phytoene/squalene synthase family protein [Pseudomonadota bacterium]